MTIAIRAIYEEGRFRPLEPLELPEHSVVNIAFEAPLENADRRQWLDQGQRTLMSLWDNESDDVYNVLLTQ